MRHFETHGTWWPSERPDDSVAGSVTFDEDGIGLLVQGDYPWLDIPASIVHGVDLDGKKYTIMDCDPIRGNRSLLGSAHQSRVTFRGRMLLQGVWAQADAFDRAEFEYDYLNAWINPPNLTGTISESQMEVRTRAIDLYSAVTEDASIGLSLRLEGATKPNEIGLRQDCAFTVETASASSHEILDKWCRPLQDLLIMSTGETVRLKGLYLRPEGAAPTDLYGRAFFSAVQPPPPKSIEEPTRSDLLRQSSRALLLLNEEQLPFADLIPKWLDLHARLHESVILLHAQHYASFMFNENKFANVFQSAEALAYYQGFSGRDKDKHLHQARVKNVVNAITLAALAGAANVEDIGWAERVLREANKKPLRKQMDELLLAAGAVGQEILKASPDFSTICAGARTGVSHGGAQKRLGPEDREQHARILRWVVRGLILKDLGLPQDEIDKRSLGSRDFSGALNKVRVFANNRLNIQIS